jgi:hypothetical protein
LRTPTPTPTPTTTPGIASAAAVPAPAVPVPSPFPLRERRRDVRPARPGRPEWLAAPAAAWALALSTVPWGPADAGRLEAVLGLSTMVLALAASVVGVALSGRVVAPVGMVAVGALATALAGYAANWSAFEPRTNFAFHRPAFAHASSQVRAGDVKPDQPAPQSLSWLVSPIAPAGAVVVGRDGDRPVVLLPQRVTGTGAFGYVYFDGQPDADLTVEADGRRERLIDGLYLGSGWWWL